MIRRQHQPYTAEPAGNVVIKPGKELIQVAIELVDQLALIGRIGADTMPEDIC